jgi:hypothetical protein
VTLCSLAKQSVPPADLPARNNRFSAFCGASRHSAVDISLLSLFPISLDLSTFVLSLPLGKLICSPQALFRTLLTISIRVNAIFGTIFIISHRVRAPRSTTA